MPVKELQNVEIKWIAVLFQTNVRNRKIRRVPQGICLDRCKRSSNNKKLNIECKNSCHNPNHSNINETIDLMRKRLISALER